MRLREQLREGMQFLASRRVPAVEASAELLLMHITGMSRGDLYSHGEDELDSEAIENYQRLLEARAGGTPVQYLTGRQEFWGLEFEVTPEVLIPRPETELLVETALELLDAAPGDNRKSRGGAGRERAWRIADVGTGSGCIILSLASELPQAHLMATDISAAAIQVARRNASRLGFEARVSFFAGDLLGPLTGGGDTALDMIVSNPPYVSRQELENAEPQVRDFEPRLALGGEEDPVAIYERLFQQAWRVLKPGGWVLVEIGYGRREQVTQMLTHGWQQVEVRPDLAGIPRVVVARRP